MSKLRAWHGFDSVVSLYFDLKWFYFSFFCWNSILFYIPHISFDTLPTILPITTYKSITAHSRLFSYMFDLVLCKVFTLSFELFFNLKQSWYM